VRGDEGGEGVRGGPSGAVGAEHEPSRVVMCGWGGGEHSKPGQALGGGGAGGCPSTRVCE
jgi:hypothetical protein